MRTYPFGAVLLISAFLIAPAMLVAATGAWDEAKIVAQATGGRFKATKGKYLEKSCGESLDYNAEFFERLDRLLRCALQGAVRACAHPDRT